MNSNPFVWDAFSDQPYPIKDRAYKRSKRKQNILSIIWTALISSIIFPFAIIAMPFFKVRKSHELSNFFGIGVNLDKESDHISQKKLVEELDIDHLLIRIPLSDISNLDKYIAFINLFGDKDVMVNLIQDRVYIEDLDLLEETITTLFKVLPTHVTKMQVGNAINRTKWGFFSIGEYLGFYSCIKKVRDRTKRQIKLLGPSVIDFEFYYIVHALFSLKGKFDGLSSLLYVDRRGAPENRQTGLNLRGKINLLYSIMTLSPFTKNELFITETNWPIFNTAPYAPTSEAECVSLNDYRDYLVRYYLLSIATGKVTTVYWHQLVAAGYGLIDQRDSGSKYPAFEAFKQMNRLLKKSFFISIKKRKNIYHLKFKTQSTVLSALWGDDNITFKSSKRIHFLDGTEISSDTITLSSTPIFVENY